MGGLRVLLTNWTLVGRHGSVTHLRDLALGLLRAGHAPVLYAPEHGELAFELTQASIPVVSDLTRIGQPPDVIHGHGPNDLLAALHAFPSVPGVFTCHAWISELAEPPVLDRVRRYVAVDETCRDRLISLSGLSCERVAVHYNAVDLERFPPRPPLPRRPGRALVFSNYASEQGYLRTVRETCAAAGLALDVLGQGAGNVCSAPERLLAGYDVVFAKARAAMEALAVGCAVILCDEPGLGGMVNTSNWAQLRRWNFGRRALQAPVTAERIAAALACYDAADAGEVSARMRAEVGLHQAVREMITLYRTIIAEHAATASPDPHAESQAVGRYFQWFARPYAEWLRGERNGLAILHRVASVEAEAVLLRNEKAGRAEESARRREEAARLREEVARLREEATCLHQTVAAAHTETKRARHELVNAQEELRALRASATIRIKELVTRMPIMGGALRALARVVP